MTTVQPHSSRRRRRLVEAVPFWLAFAGPGVLVYLVFVTLPTILSLAQSLTNMNPFNPPTKWVGLENYADLFTDPSFHAALRNTLVIALIVVVVPNVLGLLIAMLLNRPTRLYRVLRSVYFTPVILSAVVVSIIWQSILASGGMLDRFLMALGVDEPPGWLSDPDLALYSLGSILVWQSLGFCVVVYLAGLQTVPTDLYEAAAIDGATPVQRFRRITWPMLAPATTVITVMLLINAFKLYDHVQVITNGGPGVDATTSLAFNVVQTGFTANRIGYASTYATVMLVLVAVLSVVLLRFLQRREEVL